MRDYSDVNVTMFGSLKDVKFAPPILSPGNDDVSDTAEVQRPEVKGFVNGILIIKSEPAETTVWLSRHNQKVVHYEIHKLKHVSVG